MNIKNTMQVGEIVTSLVGRDKNKYYMILAIKDEYVYYVDGDTRKIEKPKIKKQKHVRKTNILCYDIISKIRNNENISNKEINKSIKENIPLFLNQEE